MSDTVENNITIKDETYLKFVLGSEGYSGSHIAVTALQGLVETGCIPDYVTATVILSNVGTEDYDFNITPVKLYMQVTQPVPFYMDTVISSDMLPIGGEFAVKLTNMFPTVIEGQYDIRIWIDSINPIVYDDTLVLDYVSGKFSLPIDEDFSSGIPIVFESKGFNSYNKWDTVSQGKGTDATVMPQFGTGMLSFGGSPGSMTRLSTQQLDLSRTVKPTLSFWYFHDTIPCEDYTDVYITIDGNEDNYTTLFSLTKYDPVYGWRQYNMDLPAYAVNQCVKIAFEAMEKSRSGNVTQYIDRIRIVAKQDIAVTKVFSEFTACNLQNKEWKVVLSNLTDPVLDYSATPTEVTLEIFGTSHRFTKQLSAGTLAGFASDTIILSPTFSFAPGTYQVKAYFNSVLDDDRMNDTLVSTLVINPKLEVQLTKLSTSTCLIAELPIYQEVVLTNTGNMDLSNIELELRIDTGETVTSLYTIISETFTGTIVAGNSERYSFTEAYTVPWNTNYYVRVTTRLKCNSALANDTKEIEECVDMKDLSVVSIDYPFAATDNIGNSIQPRATLRNRNDVDDFRNARISVQVKNSQGVQTASFSETRTIGALATVNHTFTQSYTVPNDSVYYLTVYVDHYDNYLSNDTVTIKRYTQSVGIETLEESNMFVLGQNIPNPANNRTRIDYSVPEAGEVIFHVHSISGQLLYSKTIEAPRGNQYIELNTSTLAAGIYFYSMEYKGQKLVKRMSVR
jgi:hypothetical protein